MNENKKHNFNPGTSTLPESVSGKAAEAVLDWSQMGISILEVSNRSLELERVILKTQFLVKELRHVPESYSILFFKASKADSSAWLQ